MSIVQSYEHLYNLVYIHSFEPILTSIVFLVYTYILTVYTELDYYVHFPVHHCTVPCLKCVQVLNELNN